MLSLSKKIHAIHNIFDYLLYVLLVIYRFLYRIYEKIRKS